MTGRIVDNLLFGFKNERFFENLKYLDTSYGKIRIFDSGGNNPVIINAPDGPNTIEHQIPLLRELSKNYRVICFEYPGVGFSYPNSKYDYSFSSGANLIFEIMEILKIAKGSLVFSCFNGYYALNAAMISSDKFNHVFIIQTPSINSIVEWTKKSIPTLLKIPIVGQLTNKVIVKKLSNVWYDVSLPRNSDLKKEFKRKSYDSLCQGGCFCLSSLVQGLTKDKTFKLNIKNSKVTMIWGAKDFSHRNTSKESIKDHVKNCEVIEFSGCGHFPELENSTKFVKLVNERLN